MNQQQREFSRNWEFQLPLLEQVRTILLDLPLRAFYGYFEATEEQDTKQATDAVLRLENNVAIGVRLRRDYARWRDWTVRSKSAGGQKTELQKLIEGFGDFYFYGWTQYGSIGDWMLLDLSAVRKSGILVQPRREIMNPDGLTRFRAWTFDELLKLQTVRAANVRGVLYGEAKR